MWHFKYLFIYSYTFFGFHDVQHSLNSLQIYIGIIPAFDWLFAAICHFKLIFLCHLSVLKI